MERIGLDQQYYVDQDPHHCDVNAHSLQAKPLRLAAPAEQTKVSIERVISRRKDLEGIVFRGTCPP